MAKRTARPATERKQKKATAGPVARAERGGPYPPFMNAYGRLKGILDKIKTASTPDRFTQDFLSTKLGFKGGGAMAFIPVAKRIGLLSTEGKPTDLYRRFRNESESAAAMADALRTGYAALYELNEYVHDLDRHKLEGLLVQLTGLEQDNTTLKAIAGTFETLKGYANFEATLSEIPEGPEPLPAPRPSAGPESRPGVGFNLAYTINLVMPKTDDIAVFNAIFRSLKETLLRND